MNQLGAELLALYREARAAGSADFKAFAMARAHQLLPLHSTHWINGVMTQQGPVFHHVATEGMRAGYWEHYLTLMPIDTLGPRMFAHPGTTFKVGHDDVPPRIRDEIMRAFDVRDALQGMAADPSTGTFSVVCWHRSEDMPPFNESERLLHEQLLPHWVEGLNLHRVTRVLRDLHTTLVPGCLAALVESTGLIHHAQFGFGELLGEDFPGWQGVALPAALLAALEASNGRDRGYEGPRLSAHWHATQQQLWMVHLRRKQAALANPADQAHAVELRLLSASLEQREQELETARRALLDREKREAALQERQRILRELHDGVGAHLVGLRSLLQAGATVTDDMAQALEAAMDEMRLAVDSVHHSGDDQADLGELLAALRWRLQPRLEGAGIQLHWSMPEPEVAVAACRGLSAAAALQVQRLLLEAFTNVLKHAQASVVQVSFEPAPAVGVGWQLRVRDNGVGLPRASIRDAAGAAVPATGRGLGFANMARRAASIGARLRIQSCAVADAAAAPGGSALGTELILQWPSPIGS